MLPADPKWQNRELYVRNEISKPKKGNKLTLDKLKFPKIVFDDAKTLVREGTETT